MTSFCRYRTVWFMKTSMTVPVPRCCLFSFRRDDDEILMPSITQYTPNRLAEIGTRVANLKMQPFLGRSGHAPLLGIHFCRSYLYHEKKSDFAGPSWEATVDAISKGSEDMRSYDLRMEPFTRGTNITSNITLSFPPNSKP